MENELLIRKAECDTRLRMCALDNAVQLVIAERIRFDEILEHAQEHLDWLRKKDNANR